MFAAEPPGPWRSAAGCCLTSQLPSCTYKPNSGPHLDLQVGGGTQLGVDLPHPVSTTKRDTIEGTTELNQTDYCSHLDLQISSGAQLGADLAVLDARVLQLNQLACDKSNTKATVFDMSATNGRLDARVLQLNQLACRRTQQECNSLVSLHGSGAQHKGNRLGASGTPFAHRTALSTALRTLRKWQAVGQAGECRRAS